MARNRTDKFTWGPGDVVASQCVYCRNADPGPRRTCPAFPDGIPDAILLNEADHRRLYPGQVGTTLFEPAPDASKAALAPLYRALDALD